MKSLKILWFYFVTFSIMKKYSDSKKIEFEILEETSVLKYTELKNCVLKCLYVYLYTIYAALERKLRYHFTSNSKRTNKMSQYR